MIHDFVIVGAGISGAAVAYELSAHGSVILLEAESAPGYHSTGRSAALYTRNFGGCVVRRINQASYDFFLAPPAGFCETPLLTPRGLLTVAGSEHEADVSRILQRPGTDGPASRMTSAEACAMVPFLRPDRISVAAYESDVSDIEVASLHHGYLRALKISGAAVACGMRVHSLTRKTDHWELVAGETTWRGRTVINAAGAWADEVGRLAGARSIGLTPKRRTAIIVDLPSGVESGKLPAVDFAGSEAYIKPEAGKLMASPGDQTPVEPQDVQPEELDIAVVVDWLQGETTLQVNRIEHSWAGLRSYVKDGAPVVGFDPDVPGFFWLAGQGGYGIMMAPALGRAAASLVLGADWPDDLGSLGVVEADISPSRLTS